MFLFSQARCLFSLPGTNTTFSPLATFFSNCDFDDRIGIKLPLQRKGYVPIKREAGSGLRRGGLLQCDIGVIKGSYGMNHKDRVEKKKEGFFPFFLSPISRRKEGSVFIC